MATYAIWVWPAGGKASGVTVKISASAGKALTPRFSVCPSRSGITCTVGVLNKGQADELQARATVPTSASPGKLVKLTAKGKSTDATAPPAASASITIASKASPTPTPTGPGIGGVGASLPPGVQLPSGLAPNGSVPVVPDPIGTVAGALGFPKVSPAPSPNGSPRPFSGILPNSRDVQVANASDTFPLSTRLLGGQVVGLAVLIAALVIAIARLSLRKPRPQHSKDPAP